MNLIRKKSEKVVKIENNDSIGSKSINTPAEHQSTEQELSEQVEDSEVEYKVGNYQLRAHIIECSELIASSGTGFVDPIVFIEVLGQKVHTKQKRKCSACIFDESFYIQLSDMNESKIQDGNVAINILDCSSRISSLLSSNVIGTFSIDLETIYEHSGHEVYRQWVPLISPHKPEITGKMLLTLSLLGPGDKAVVHDRKAELIEEKRARLKAGSSSTSPVLFSAPPFAQKLSFLVVEIYKAEGIPVLDSAIIAGKMYNYISASVAVEFDQHHRVRTGTAHLIRKHMNNAEYMTALWLPYMDPSFSSRIQLRVLEHHTISDATVLSSTLCPAMHLRSVRQGMEGKMATSPTLDPTQLFWVNLYGAPVPEVVQGRDAYKSAMNLYPDTASAYRGRLLVRLRIDDNKPNAKGRRRSPEVLRYAMDREYFNMVQGRITDETSLSPWGGGLLGLSAKSVSASSDRSTSVAAEKEADKDKGGRPSVAVLSAPPLPPLHNNGTSTDSSQVRASMNPLSSPSKPAMTDIYGLPLPTTSRYVLKAMVFAGQSFPQRSGLSSTRFSVELRLMHRRLITPELHMKNGFIMWETPVLLKDTFDLPEDPAMMPDLFLYVLNKELTPLCFKRFPLAEFLSLSEEEQFTRPADWEILQLDDTFSFPSPDTFPGAVLLKIGFGKEGISERHVWNTTVNTKRTVCQVNIHVYQGRGLPPSDRSGLLDPYLVVRVGTQVLKTKVHKQTRDPQFFETLSFLMELPLDDDLKPQLFLELYDQDTLGDDFVGLIKLDLALADKRSVFNKSTEQLLAAQLKDPVWYGLRSRKGADLMGQLLVGFEVLNLDRVDQSGGSLFSGGSKVLPSPSLSPARSAWLVDMHVLGLRDLVPPRLLPVHKPYVSIRLNNSQLCKLPPSRRPTPTDPNYLCRFEETVQLPDNVLFAPSIALTVKDKKMSALSATLLGTASIPLDYKMLSALGKTGQAMRLQRHRPQFRSGNPFTSQEELIDEQITLHDSSSTRMDDQVRWDDKKEIEKAAIVVRAELLKHAAAVKRQRPSDDLPEYLHSRLQIAAELETGLLEAPFERYPITTGSLATGIDDLFDIPFSQVGVLKCNVTLRPECAADPLVAASRNITEETLKIRLYVLRGSNLAGHDSDNLSDPYLVVKLGGRIVSTRERHKRNTRDPRFYECFEFTSKLPGVNDILISVKDHNDIYADELIGSTVIDLEDRWYCPEWKNLCRLTADSAAMSPSEPRAPLEVRSLWNPKSNAAQGTLSMWLDILTLEEARRYPIKDIAPPPQEEWEVRVVIWSASDVPSGDEFEDMNDLFVKCHLGGNSATEQSTDTHLRLPAGQKGSFNWRMKFPIKLPVSEDCEGGTRLTVEAWDLDFLTSSQGLGSCQIDLTDSLDTALRKRNRKLKAGMSTRFVHQHFYKPAPTCTRTRPAGAVAARDTSSFLIQCRDCCTAAVSCLYSWLCCRCACCFGQLSSATNRRDVTGRGSSQPTLAVDVDLELGESTPLLSGRKYEYSTAVPLHNLETIDPRLSPSDCNGGRKYHTLSPVLSPNMEVRHQLSPIPEAWESGRLEYPSQSPGGAGWSTYPTDCAGEDRAGELEPLSPSDTNGGRKYAPTGTYEGKVASERLSPSGDNGGRKYLTVLTNPPTGDFSGNDQEETELDEQGDLDDLIAPDQGGCASGDVNNKEKPRKKRKKRLSMYESTLQAMGFGVVTIEHAAEVPLTAADGSPAGKVLMSIEILHKSVADTLPAALGRSEPNAHPHLPEPEGRIDFTKMWNPFYMLRVCAGEKIFAEFSCMFSCLLCLLVYYFIGQPVLTLVMALKEFFGSQVVLILLCALLVAACTFGAYVRAKCRKVCCHSEDDEEGEG